MFNTLSQAISTAFFSGSEVSIGAITAIKTRQIY